jgi:hypothetical protein
LWPPKPAHSGKAARIEADQAIDAPSSLSWDTIEDFDSYDDWNPVFRHVEGARSRDCTGHVTVRDHADCVVKVEIKLLLSEPPAVLAWRWRMPALSELAPEQYFYIDSPADGRSHVYVGTSFCGPFAAALAVGLRPIVEPLLRNMCLALKARVEQRGRL